MHQQEVLQGHLQRLMRFLAAFALAVEVLAGACWAAAAAAAAAVARVVAVLKTLSSLGS
jgi:hypothetical protein